MSRVVGVRYEKGVLRPLEPVDLREGEEVRINREEYPGEGKGSHRYTRRVQAWRSWRGTLRRLGHSDPSGYEHSSITYSTRPASQKKR